MSLNNEILLGRIPRDAENEWKIIRGNYWNKEVVDIRLYSNNTPTSKGVRFNLEELAILKQILQKVDDEEE